MIRGKPAAYGDEITIRCAGCSAETTVTAEGTSPATGDPAVLVPPGWRRTTVMVMPGGRWTDPDGIASGEDWQIHEDSWTCMLCSIRYHMCLTLNSAGNEDASSCTHDPDDVYTAEQLMDETGLSPEELAAIPGGQELLHGIPPDLIAASDELEDNDGER